MTRTERLPSPPAEFEQHPHRGPFNAAFFAMVGPSLEQSMGPQKQRVFRELPPEVVEIGSGVGANLAYIPKGGTLVALEPNRAMHERLHTAARQQGVQLDLRERTAERTGLETASADCVISSLVLCTVRDPAIVLAEVRRVLRPGGTFRFAEHVAAEAGSATRAAQRLLRRPWAWTFEGCSCERDLEAAIRSAGFAHVELERYRISSPLLPFNTHIAGIATA
jgi:SAM-dependent methyltransferase